MRAKLKLKDLKRQWEKELPKGSTNETPYALAFSSKKVVPIEIGLPTEQVERTFNER